jgi:hypothetical protein
MHMKYGAHSSGMGNTAVEARADLRRQQEKAIRGHRADVARALAEGKPVPAEVLADYPDLAPTLPAAAPAVPQPPPAVDTSATARKEDSVTPLTPETLLVGDILISDAGLCVVVELEQGGYVTVRPLDGARFTPLAPADLALFRKTGDKDLKPALLRHLEQNAEARLADLQDRWGYSRAMGNTPETNPLNRALKDLVDSGLVTVFSDDWGYATNPLIKRAASVAPATPPAPTGGNPKPLGDVPVTDETRYFGTELTVTSHGELIQTWLSRIYNLGTVFECHNPNCPHDPQATFRVPGDQVVSIDRLVDRQLTPDAPLPQVPPPPDTGADLTSLELGAVYRDFLARQMSVSASPSEAALQQYARAARDILNGHNPAVTPEEFARFVRVRLAGSAQGFALADVYTAFTNGQDFTPDQVRAMQAERAAHDAAHSPAPAPTAQAPATHPLIATLEARIAEWGGTDGEITRVIWQLYSGDDARKTRQALMTALTGVKTPVAQCGVSALERAYRAWKARQAEQTAAPPAEPAPHPQTPTCPVHQTTPEVPTQAAQLTQLTLF